eukprot:364541-Chlamydomonas_euryale.AAC.13
MAVRKILPAHMDTLSMWLPVHTNTLSTLTLVCEGHAQFTTHMCQDREQRHDRRTLGGAQAAKVARQQRSQRAESLHLRARAGRARERVCARMGRKGRGKATMHTCMRARARAGPAGTRVQGSRMKMWMIPATLSLCHWVLGSRRIAVASSGAGVRIELCMLVRAHGQSVASVERARLLAGPTKVSRVWSAPGCWLVLPSLLAGWRCGYRWRAAGTRPCEESI